MTEPRYWLMPPEDYRALDEEFEFDFDPCPCPRPEGYNGLVVPWGWSNWVNPPFRKTDGNTDGPTAFVHKAIAEQAQGKSSVLILPVPSYIPLLAAAGAEFRPAGPGDEHKASRMRFLEVDTGEPWPSPSPTI